MSRCANFVYPWAILTADIGVMEVGEAGALVDSQKLAVSCIQKVVFEVRPAEFKSPCAQEAHA